MGEVDEIFDLVLQYEEDNNLQDISSPDEMEDIDLSPVEIKFLQKEGTNFHLYQKEKKCLLLC